MLGFILSDIYSSIESNIYLTGVNIYGYISDIKILISYSGYSWANYPRDNFSEILKIFVTIVTLRQYSVNISEKLSLG